MVFHNPHYRTQIIEATYDGGVLRPLRPLSLREHERVRLIVQRVDADDGADHASRAQAMRRLRDGIERMNFQSTGAYPTREELHDSG